MNWVPMKWRTRESGQRVKHLSWIHPERDPREFKVSSVSLSGKVTRAIEYEFIALFLFLHSAQICEFRFFRSSLGNGRDGPTVRYRPRIFTLD